jgi:hypothetical protein
LAENKSIELGKVEIDEETKEKLKALGYLT